MRMGSYLKRYVPTAVAFVVLLLLTAGILYIMGRVPLSPDGSFGWWEGDIWSSYNSQRVADPYTFSHFLHGLIFFWFLWVFARRLPLRYRFLIGVVIEIGWEILENSPLIINRYREATLAQGYSGDSVMNSVADVVAMAVGFLVAYRVPVAVSVFLFVIIEVVSAGMIRDNLTLNVVMLLYPLDVIKEWQLAGSSL